MRPERTTVVDLPGVATVVIAIVLVVALFHGWG